MKQHRLLSVIKKHSFFFAAVLLLMLSAASCLLIAKYVSSSNTMTGVYVPAPYHAVTVLSEQGTDEDSRLYLTNVRVQSGDQGYPVYVRVTLAVQWVDEQGRIYGQQPISGVDYTLSYNENDWSLYPNDGFYYYRTALPSGGTTAPLITSAQKLKQIKDPPESGYRLKAEVACETIQAVGTTHPGNIAAVVDAWNHHP